MDFQIRLKKSSLSLYLVVLGMWVIFVHQALLSFAISEMKVAYSGYFLLFLAFFIELRQRAFFNIKRKYQLWILCIWIFSFFVFCYGIVKSHNLQYLSRDIWPYSYFACLLLAARTKRWHIIDKMIYQQFLIGLGIFILIWFIADISFQREVIEINTLSLNTPHIYLAAGLLYGWQYMFLSLKQEDSTKRKIATYLGLALYVVFGLIMLKRQVIIELGLMGLFRLIYNSDFNKAQFLKWLTIYIAIIVVIFSFVRFYEKREDVSYIEQILLRSTESGSVLETAFKNTRLYETPLNIYNQASALEILYGQGLGSVVEKEGVIDNVVESGLFTTLLKGGIIYLLIWYSGFILILFDTLVVIRGRKLLFGLLSAIFIVGSPVFPFFIDYPSSGYQMFWLGKFISRSQEL